MAGIIDVGSALDSKTVQGTLKWTLISGLIIVLVLYFYRKKLKEEWDKWLNKNTFGLMGDTEEGIGSKNIFEKWKSNETNKHILDGTFPAFVTKRFETDKFYFGTDVNFSSTSLDTLNKQAKELYDSVGYFYDSPERLTNMISKIPNKLYLSEVLRVFKKNYSKDFFEWIMSKMDKDNQKKYLFNFFKTIDQLPLGVYQLPAMAAGDQKKAKKGVAGNTIIYITDSKGRIKKSPKILF